ncbi:MAG: chemotaxis protein CheB [Rhodothermales bacterium]|nr:chemotaxis protein CheB [Rhodothermales bacterium]
MNRLILLGGSAGGLDAALTVVARLDADLPAAVFVVLHLGDGPGQSLLDKLAAAGPFPAAFAADGDPVETGRIYVAPPDHHTLLHDHRIRLSRGPRVNRARPAIDLAFRSAAVAYREKTIGVVLSGMLDDGAAGLLAIARCGGRAIVQDPDEAPHASMPESALASVKTARRLPAASIGMLLDQLGRTPVLTEATVPPAIALENRFDMNGTDDLAEMDDLGSQVPMSCPECNGPLWEIEQDGLPRYRCHVGHSLTAHTLLATQGEEIEQSLWIALRTLEEKARMQERLVRWEREAGRGSAAGSFESRAAETRAHAERLRAVLNQLGMPERPTGRTA